MIQSKARSPKSRGTSRFSTEGACHLVGRAAILVALLAATVVGAQNPPPPFRDGAVLVGFQPGVTAAQQRA
jgi:hypothetical protein